MATAGAGRRAAFEFSRPVAALGAREAAGVAVDFLPAELRGGVLPLLRALHIDTRPVMLGYAFLPLPCAQSLAARAPGAEMGLLPR